MMQTANVLIKPKSANYHHIVNINSWRRGANRSNLISTIPKTCQANPSASAAGRFEKSVKY